MPESNQPPLRYESANLRLAGKIVSACVKHCNGLRTCKDLVLQTELPLSDDGGSFTAPKTFVFPVDYQTPLHGDLFEDGEFEIIINLRRNKNRG